ncbi:MAG: IPTL-CTERM sorting domain-containing protein [Thermodesulfobacteriota bacterium]
MNYISRIMMPVFIFTLFVAGLLLAPALNDSAHAQCALTLCKESPDLPIPESEEDAFFFFYSIEQGGQGTVLSLPANGPCFGDAFGGNDLEIVESVPEGWTLENVECSDSALIDVTFIENGVSLDCLGGTEITCTFTNVRGARPIPTLSEWGMIAAAGGLALIGVFFAMRRRKAQAA